MIYFFTLTLFISLSFLSLFIWIYFTKPSFLFTFLLLSHQKCKTQTQTQGIRRVEHKLRICGKVSQNFLSGRVNVIFFKSNVWMFHRKRTIVTWNLCVPAGPVRRSRSGSARFSPAAFFRQQPVRIKSNLFEHKVSWDVMLKGDVLMGSSDRKPIKS